MYSKSNAITLICHIFLGFLTLFFYFYRKSVLHFHLETGLLQETFGGESKFLTVWGCDSTLIYFFLSIINDAYICFSYSNEQMPFIGILVKHLYSSVTALHATICVVCWPLYFYNPGSLTNPATYEGFAWHSTMFNHGYLCIIIHSLSFVYRYQARRMKIVLYLNCNYCRYIFSTIMIVFCAWSMFCDYMNGKCSYPFLDEFSYAQLHMIYVCLAILSLAVHEIILICFVKRIYAAKKDAIKIM